MKHVNTESAISRIGNTRHLLSLTSVGAALLSVLLGSPVAAHAGLWEFALKKAPKAVVAGSPTGEYLRMSGGGTFDPVAGIVSASGSWNIQNAFDESPTGVFTGNWVATGFDSFTPAMNEDGEPTGGTLTVTVTFNFDIGFTLPGVKLTVLAPLVNGHPQRSQDAILVVLDEDETFTPPPGGSWSRSSRPTRLRFWAWLSIVSTHCLPPAAWIRRWSSTI